jgi:hypothetical protein
MGVPKRIEDRGLFLIPPGGIYSLTIITYCIQKQQYMYVHY